MAIKYRNPFDNEVYIKRTKPHKKDVRGEYFRDQTKIIHSLPFRRLKHKTQVFFAPDNDHICTRIEHVLHVATISATICRGLNQTGEWELCEDLAYAIGLAHDLGHAPFGHEGEKAIAKCITPAPFMHEINSYRVVEYLANYGEGLNLTYAVKDGILCHCGEDFNNNALKPTTVLNDLDKIDKRVFLPTTYEGCIVRLSDKIAYLGRDIEDAIKAKFITKTDIPEIIRKEIGASNGEIINTLTLDLISHAEKNGVIGFSREKFDIVTELRKFNYSNIYYNEQMQERKRMIDKGIAEMFAFFGELFDKNGFYYPKYDEGKKRISSSFGNYIKSMNNLYKEDISLKNQIITDYISGMTDSYALETLKDIMLPTAIKFKL
ncbi:Putative deoxyguanosinetriphosphate triphosphohydrolase [Elusimicrobium minutum Pei191]|uniref:Putative deoxyguanosinetriphosphate triphosphohydrolase n=1 Tax=Elusimicrobium minutum (strain Pei191) TaxID=445932 RepID=B2KAX5_ELUMP|nr:HD domain-containing protein [Elusimicrobium minutum]ACC97671.1 Putative deoxyguanosinetriphosphate triphosphohydrolase [Elusimicrobium minutum Pei191]